jgi:multidrug efflux system membrane fusion protein
MPLGPEKPATCHSADVRRPAISRAAAALAVATLLLAGCAAPTARREVRVPVTVAAAIQQAVPDVIEATGTVEPRQTVAINPQVGGLITAVRFREGEEVRTHQVLIEIDRRPYRAALDQASASLARDRAQAETAHLNLVRAQTLLESGAISQQDFDAQRALAAGLAATVRGDSASVQRATLDLDNCTVRSPIDGRTGSLNLHLGNLVKGNDTASPVVTVNQIRPILVRFTVPQQELPRILRRRGDQLVVTASSSDDTTLASTGALTFLDNAVDASSGTIELKAEFPNRDGRLWPGEFVRARLILTIDPRAIVIPLQAVTLGQAGAYVYVVNADTTVTSRTVTISRNSGLLAVVGSGLEPGERVVVDGQLRLSPGAKISIKSPPKPSGGTSAASRP